MRHRYLLLSFLLSACSSEAITSPDLTPTPRNDGGQGGARSDNRRPTRPEPSRDNTSRTAQTNDKQDFRLRGVLNPPPVEDDGEFVEAQPVVSPAPPVVRVREPNLTPSLLSANPPEERDEPTAATPENNGGVLVPSTCEQARGYEGCCLDNVVYSCGNALVQTPPVVRCEGTLGCGWSEDVQAYRCGEAGNQGPHGGALVACGQIPLSPLQNAAPEKEPPTSTLPNTGSEPPPLSPNQSPTVEPGSCPDNQAPSRRDEAWNQATCGANIDFTCCLNDEFFYCLDSTKTGSQVCSSGCAFADNLAVSCK